MRAEELDLARTQAWRVLGHYKGRSPGRWLSQADGEDFFLSPRGADDPEAELLATLAAFFQAPPPPPVGEPTHLDQHPQCRFPRRFAWLDEQLGLDPARLPRQECPELADWKQRLGATRVTLVFAWTANPFIYPIAGIVGWFPGTYATIPYYLKVREYNALENRDLWVLEAMDPSLRLTDRYTAWVFPTATLRAVTERTDLVEEPAFRPSLYRELIARRDALQPEDRRLAQRLARRIDEPERQALALLEPPRQAVVLDAAWELQRYRAGDEPDPAQRAHDQALLVARRRVAISSEAPVIPTPEPPERGHRGGMSALGIGQGPEGSFARVRLRAAMHDPLAS